MANIFDTGRCDLPAMPSIIGQPLVPNGHIPDVPRPITQGQTYLLLLQPPVAVGRQGSRGSRGSIGPPGSDGSDGTQVFLGQVQSGSGNTWMVKIYPHGPLDTTSAFDATINILNTPNNGDIAPANDWIDPIEEFESEYYYARPGCGKLAMSPSGGIPGLVSGVPQSALCVIYYFTGTSLSTLGTANVFTSTTAAVGGNKLLQVQNVDGFWFCVVEDCG